MRPHRALAALLASVLLASLAVLTTPRSVTSVSAAPPAPAERPNIVLVLMDDSSLYLLQTMATARQMAQQGADYQSAYVVDSLCCVSRTTIMTGQYPHQTRVYTNVAGSDPANPVGGWAAFKKHRDGDRTVNLDLHRSGYTTGFIGKYLNGFNSRGQRETQAPPGWSEFMPFYDSAYDQWSFKWGLSVDGGPLEQRRVTAPPVTASDKARDAAYAGVIAQRRALDFMRRHQTDKAPYFLQVSVYATHARATKKPFYRGDPVFPAMMRDRPSSKHPGGNCGAVGCADLTTADLPGFGDPRADNVPRRAAGQLAPAWQRDVERMPVSRAERLFRDQARMAQSVDRMLQRILATVDGNTYVILTSDNGLHTGQWGLTLGKGTAYGSDVRVPMIVVGPGVTPGARAGFVSNLDLAPTIEELAGLPGQPFRSGVSFADSLADPAAADRRYVFTEHTWSGVGGFDPDAADSELATIPSYLAVRSADGLLIRYDYDTRPGVTLYAYELYDLSGGQGEVTNVYGDPDVAPLQQELAAKLADFEACTPQVGADPVPQECRDITR